MYSQRKNLRSGASNPGTSQQNFSSSVNVSSQQLSTQLSQLQVQDEGSSDSDEGEEYGDMHRLVLQGVMAAGYLNADGVKKLFEESCKVLKCKVAASEHLTMKYIQKIVREINERVQSYDMMIRSATCEITGHKFYVFLVRIEKQIMKFQTYFTKVELDLFQKILDSILTKHHHFSIPMAECINLCDELDHRTFTKPHAEDFVKRMISLQYFTTVGSKINFEVTLGFRTIREFEHIFSESYQDVFANCCLCKTVLLNGLQCPKCTAVVHKGCLKKYLQNSKICCSCKCPWRSDKALLIRTRNGNGEAQFQPSGPTQAAKKATQELQGGPGAKKARQVDIGDEVDMPILEPMVSPRSAGTSSSTPSPKKMNKDSSLSSSASSTKSVSPVKKNLRERRTRNRVHDSDSE